MCSGMAVKSSAAMPIVLAVLGLLIVHPTYTEATWLYLGIASLASSQLDSCGIIPGLVIQQMEVCRENPEAMPCVAEGVRRGIMECQSQFKHERWNCSTTASQSVFGPLLHKATKETAFIYAVTSAGVVHSVTQSCSTGNLTDCSCDTTRDGDVSAEGDWKWGGCSDDIGYGVWFSRTFVDAPESSQDTDSKNKLRALMNLHNNEVGRKVIKAEMALKCRCHGVSGSCAVKSCWKTMPHFFKVGELLKKRYENSVEISPRSKRRLRRKDKRFRKVPIDGKDFVHIEHSPNFCRKDKNVGIIGTKGRECNKTSHGPDSCNLLCCGRGYNTRVVRYVERCHCKFIWCCEVKCKFCETMIDIHTCK